MSLFAAHSVILLVASLAAAGRLVRPWGDRLLAALLLAWANLVATSLLLASLRLLGEPGWFFRTSLLLAGATWLLLRRAAPDPAPAGPEDAPAAGALALFLVTLLPLAWMGLRIAATYEPNNYDSLTYHLPRAMYYLGQGDLAHFDTGNPRQTYFPFNYNLLQLFALVYSPPGQVLNGFNLLAWAAAGLAIYRLSRLAGLGAHPALAAAWLTLTATQVLAQGTATTNDLPTGAALLVALVFALRWRASRAPRDALLAGLGTGVAVGSKLTMVFFAPAGGLLVLFLAAQHWRRRDLPAFFAGVRAWILPGLLAFAFASPFALINLAEKGEWINQTYDFTLNRPFSGWCVVQTASAYLVQFCLEPLHRFTFDLKLTEEFNAWGVRTFFPHWNPAHAFSPLYLFPPDLNEDHVWFGLTGPALLLSAAWCLLRARRVPAPVAWLAWVSLGWFATYFLLNKWSLYNQRYFTLPVLVMGPCLGAVLEYCGALPALRRPARAVLVVLAGSALWMAGIYLFQNTSRPYRPLWAGTPPPPALPALPPLFAQRLAGEPRINIDTTDGNERVFLFMNLGRHQRFTSFDRTDPAAYNLFSHWGFVRKVAYSNIEQLSSYTVVPVAGKRTAGVEFLGTLGSGQPALDYYGLPPHPEAQPATPGNQHVMVTFYYGPRNPDRYAKLRVKVAGLNAPDRARVRVGVDYEDGSSQELAAFTATGDARASVTRPFRRFTVRVEDLADGRLLGATEVPYVERDDPPDIEAPMDPSFLFSEELVTPFPSGSRIRTEGLGAPEGPYPQWDLPVIRWAKAPVLRLELPESRKLKRLVLAFELRLHTREAASFDVLFNGELVQACSWDQRTGWYIKSLTLAPRAGPNVIEFRNVRVGTEPDWADYLERYPDVKQYLLAQGLPLEAGAREHYENFGRRENRRVNLRRQTETLAGEPLYYLFRSLRVDGFRTP